jgi:hypothetical protein
MLAGYTHLKVFMVYRLVFADEDEVAKFRQSADLDKFTFLKTMTLEQVSEHVSNNPDNVQLAPLDPIKPEEKK